MIGTVIFFSILFVLILTLIVYAKSDTMDPVEHKRELLNYKKSFYMESAKYNKDSIGVPFSKDSLKWNPKRKNWE